MLHGFYKFFLSGAVSLYIVGKPLRQRPFQLGVCPPLPFMGAHIVPKGQVPADIVPIIPLEDMHLMGTLVAALAQVSPAGYPPLSQIFIAPFAKPRPDRVHLFQALHHPHDVDNGLGRQSGDRRAPDMV